jgi:fumarate reductase subunit C
VRLYFLQRASAALMAPLLIGHLLLIFYATAKGLTAADLLGRTRGSFFWGGYYTLLVAAASVHAGIGLAGLAGEWLGWRGRARAGLMWGAGLLLLALGLRAVRAVVIG